MDIGELEEIFKNKIQIRDTLPSIKKEINELEEQDIIKKYIELRDLFDNNKELYNKTDNEILDIAIDNQNIDINLNGCYFLLGNEYKALMKKNGEYFILPEDSQFKMLFRPLQVAVYKNFEDPSDIIIVPLKDVEKFEKEHAIIKRLDEDPEKEYKKLRNLVYKDEIKEYKNKVLTKKM